MKKIDTILFDLDGTLVNSIELIIKSFRATLQKYLPNRDFSRLELIEMIGPPLKESFRIATSDPLIIQEMIRFYRQIYVEIEFDNLDIYPNVINVLETLSRRGFNLGIVTTKFKESAIPSIKHYGLNKYITSYCFLDDVLNHKPHPEPIFYALNQFSHYQGVLMVGDNASDILAGRNATAKTCGVDWATNRETLLKLKPDFWISDFSELITIIDEFNKEVK